MSESLFNKVSRWRIATLLKKRCQHWCFSENLAKFDYLFYGTPPEDASVISGEMKYFQFGVRQISYSDLYEIS